MTEYIPWYQPGAPLVQCAECFALVVSGNTQGHDEWHERVMMKPSTAEVLDAILEAKKQANAAWKQEVI